MAIKKILVKNKDLGFLTATDIPVTRKELIDGVKTIIWCNHAGAKEIPVEHRMFLGETESEWITYALECRACGAIKHENFIERWEDAPEDGVF